MSKHIETRQEFQSLAEMRLDESRFLLDAGKWAGAYYLAGYAVELGLKACIIKMLMGRDAFPGKDFSRHCYTHNLDTLVAAADLKDALEAALGADAEMRPNWILTKDWSEEKRYHSIDEVDATALIRAIGDDKHGVMRWIKAYW